MKRLTPPRSRVTSPGARHEESAWYLGSDIDEDVHRQRAAVALAFADPDLDPASRCESLSDLVVRALASERPEKH